MAALGGAGYLRVFPEPFHEFFGRDCMLVPPVRPGHGAPDLSDRLVLLFSASYEVPQSGRLGEQRVRDRFGHGSQVGLLRAVELPRTLGQLGRCLPGGVPVRRVGDRSGRLLSVARDEGGDDVASEIAGFHHAHTDSKLGELLPENVGVGHHGEPADAVGARERFGNNPVRGRCSPLPWDSARNGEQARTIRCVP